MQFFPTVDEDVQYFRSEGYTGSINDMHYAALGDLGYSGALTDRLRAYLLDEFGSYHEAMRDLRNGTSVFALLSYKVLDFDPALVLDFDATYYRTDGTATDLVSAATHTRAGNATMVDSDGVLKWAPHNLLKYSEQFDNAAWGSALGAPTVTANIVTAPDGTTTADRVVFEASDVDFQQTVDVAVGVQNTFAVWVRADAPLTIRLGGFLGGFADAETKSVTTEWQLFSVAAVPTAGLRPLQIRSDGADTIYVWGAHAYRSDLGGMVDSPATGDSYVPTTDSARFLPRVGHHIWNGSAWVDAGYLHESEARTNLLLDSGNPTTTSWNIKTTTATKNAVGLGGVADTAWTLEDDNAAGYELNQQTITVANDSNTHTAQFWIAKDSDTSRFPELQLELNGGTIVQSYVSINTATGAFTSRVNNGGDDRYVIDEGDFWRVVISITNNSSGNTTLLYKILPAAFTSFGGSASANVTGSIIYAGGQLEAGSTLSSYIPTAGATVTRAADAMTIPAANLPWPTPEVIGPELVTNGTFDTDVSGWVARANCTISSVGGRLRVTATDTGAIRTYTEVTTEVGKVYEIKVTGYNLSGAQTSVYFQSSSSVDIATKTLVEGEEVSLVVVATETTHRIEVGNSGGNSIDDILEFDNISVSETNPLAVSIQMEGTMTYADEGISASGTGRGSNVDFYVWRTDDSNYISGQLDTLTGGSTGRVVPVQEASGVVDTVQRASGSDYSPGINVPFNIASRHGSTFINGAVDGTALTADLTPTTLPYLENTDMEVGFDFNGTIKLFRVWADDLTDAGIEEASA